MKCTSCGKDNNWLTFIGADNVCNKCVEKKTIFKEMRFSNDKRMVIALKKRKIKSFDDLCKMTDLDFENILLTEPNIGTYKPKKLKKFPSAVDKEPVSDIPLE